MIRILDKNVSDKIAAGEVVESPLSVVKELVENSIDAGAKNIAVQIKGNGSEYIRVSDDGCGIAGDEVETAFKRHATSKLEKFSDLNNLHTLGFRGEALASIAKVSGVIMYTKRREDSLGTELALEAGEVIKKEDIAGDDGTGIIVQDLFFNIPARKKDLSYKRAKKNEIVEFINRMSIYYSDISFRLKVDEELLYVTEGNGNRRDVLAQIYGADYAARLVQVDEEAFGITVSGLVSPQGDSYKDTSRQVIFINGRAIRSAFLEGIIKREYSDIIMGERYPSYFLLVNLPGAEIDVNIHPNKKEILFLDKAKVKNVIVKTLEKAFSGKEIIQSTPLNADFKSFVKEDYVDIGSSKQSNVEEVFEKGSSEGFSYSAASSEADFREAINIGSRGHKGLESAFPPADNDASEEEAFREAVRCEQQRESLREAEHVAVEEKAVNLPYDIAALEPMGVIFDTYILARDGEAFYMIDQHAAHERVFYEKLLGEFLSKDKDIQRLIAPIIKSLSAEADSNKKNIMSRLFELGFEVDDFGEKTLRIFGIPSFMKEEEAQGFLDDYLMSTQGFGYDEDERQLDRIASKACKAAVKGRDVLKGDEIKALILSLAKCKQPLACPHGRPTMIRMREYDIEKMFKRVL